MDKVLIAHKDSELLGCLQRDLQKFVGQFEVVIAASGPKALEKLRQERISVLVAAGSMPTTDGLDLLDYMRRHRPQVPCIVITDSRDPDVMKAAERNHILGWIAKPVDAGELFALIMEGLDRLDEGVFWREHRSR